MEWLWVVFGLLAGFAMLSLMGSERQRRINDRLAAEAAHAAQSADPAAAAEPPRAY